MKKRWKAWLSFVLVMVLSVSFSVPVSASSSVQWKLYRSSSTSNTTFRSSQAEYVRIVDFDTYVTRYTVSGSNVDILASSQGFVSLYYFRLSSFFPPADSATYRIRCSRFSGTYSNIVFSSSASAVYNPYFLIGSYSDMYSDTGTPFRLSYNSFYYDVINEACSLWFVMPVYHSDGLSTFSFSVSYTVGDIYYSTFGTDISINESIDKMDADLISSFKEQTDTLTNGYSNDQMEGDNKKLADSMSSYEHAESQVTDQSVEYIDAVTFFDPTTHLQLMSCITYTSTFLQNLFVALGDWSILIMIALSLAFALMLIGWFKYRK